MEHMTQKLNLNKIRGAMAEKGLTQEELANKVGISSVYLSQLLNAKANMKVDLLTKISYVVEKPISYFFDAKNC